VRKLQSIDPEIFRSRAMNQSATGMPLGTPPSKREPSSSRRRLLLAAAGLAVIAVTIAGVTLARRRGNDVEYFSRAAARGDIREVVTATGTVQAVVTVDVGSQVSGQIEQLFADYNTKVKAGQILARIDPRPFQAQLANATANLKAAEAHVRTAQAAITNQQANLKSDQANLAEARAARSVADLTLQRNATLLKRGLLAQSDYDTAKADAAEADAKFSQAAAVLEQAQAQVTSADADLAQAQAQVEQARAQVRTSELNVAYTIIRSPVDGVVVSRNVDVGQTVAASLQAPVLFVIANDLTKMRVNANVDEADIGGISENEPVSFFVDAYPHDVFKGRVAEIRLDPQTLQNVVTYSVIIDVDNPDMKLRPGMTANVTATVAERRDVLSIPNAALRYAPADSKGLVAAMSEGRGASPTSPAPGSGSRPLPAGGAEAGRGKPGVPRSGATGTSGTGPATLPDRGLARAPSPAAQQPMLAPGQDWNNADKISFPREAVTSVRPAVVWVLDRNGTPVPRKILIGLTDGVSTQVVSGDLRAGDRVVIADTSEGPAPGQPGGNGGRGRGMFRF
jgi:HlyD family secretion protein